MCVQTICLTDPAIPFKHETKATEGRLYTIIGKVPSHGRRFSVNFCIGGENGNTALHLDTRLDKKCVVRNSWIDKTWGPEEREGGNSPLSQGQQFEMMILVDANRFYIAYNGVQFAEYEHRLPPSDIDTITINGDVAVSSYSEEQTGSRLAEVQPRSSERRIKATSHEKGKLIYDLPEFSDKTVLRIIGITNGSFVFNFVNKASTEEDVGLHLNYRHRVNKVVLNSLSKGKWQEEVRPTQLPFLMGHHFDLAITAAKKELRLQLGDNPKVSFPLRNNNSTSDLKHLVVDGDVHMVWLSHENTH